MYVRVKDPTTRHEFDLPEQHPHIRKGLVEVVKPKQYPPSPLMRRPKHHTRLAAQTVAQKPEPAGEGTDIAPKENPDG